MLDYLLSRPPDLVGFVLSGIAFVIALSLHEFGHAAVANMQGDPTARLAGRLTLNPLAHLDPVGTFMIVLVGFGWGKPVPFTATKLKSRRFGPALVGVAGPAMNFVLAFAAAALLVMLGPGSERILAEFLVITLQLNVVLAIFNLLPIPPLDGSRILSAALPPSKQHIIYFLDRWGFVILLIVVFFLFRPLVSPLIRAVIRGILAAVSG
ncbi:MAG: site-2 protease family protein [Actinomycetota bacterium]|nr:site-2 protease family protein [Actinomycetota bacterium]